MAADTAGPPPGFEGASEDGSREPPDVPPTPSLGRRGNGEPVESRTTSGSDNGSHGRHAEVTAGAGEEHQHTDSSLHEWNVGKEATHHEWRTGSGAAPAEEPERGARSDGRDHGGHSTSGRRSSWSASTSDPWNHAEPDPWQTAWNDGRRDDLTKWSDGDSDLWRDGPTRRWGCGRHDDDYDYDLPQGQWIDGGKWRDGRGQHYDQGGRWDPPRADGREAPFWLRDQGDARAIHGDEWLRRPRRLFHAHDQVGQHGAPWADGRDPVGRLHDQGDHQHAWDDGRRPDDRGPRGWEPSRRWKSCVEEDYEGRRRYGRASEKLSVPTFTAEDTDDLGGSARSYLRQIAAWRQMTLLPAGQQGLVLYQSLGGKAWIAAEELSVSRLGEDDGIEYFISWITARFLDLEVARIGRAFSDYFRKMRRRPNQTIREYNAEYDRLFGRLREVGCNLPQEAAAWMYLDRLQLDEGQELNILASVGNRYDLLRLQQAAVRYYTTEARGSHGRKVLRDRGRLTTPTSRTTTARRTWTTSRGSSRPVEFLKKWPRHG